MKLHQKADMKKHKPWKFVTITAPYIFTWLRSINSVVNSKCVALITEYDCPCLFSRQALNVVKTLLQVRLHGLWILWLSQDLQNVIIGQEIEPRENLPFGLQVCVQGFKDFLQLKTHLWQLLWQTCKAQTLIIDLKLIFILQIRWLGIIFAQSKSLFS